MPYKPQSSRADNMAYAGNCRGINLIASFKIYNKMLLPRIGSHLEPIVQVNQHGSRPRKIHPGADTYFNKTRRRNQSNDFTAVLTFVDLGKAFHSIHTGKQITISYSLVPDSFAFSFYHSTLYPFLCVSQYFILLLGVCSALYLMAVPLNMLQLYDGTTVHTMQFSLLNVGSLGMRVKIFEVLVS